jgi:uroporphyrinogen-III decarboxylase
MSREQFREFYLPHYEELNGWVHAHTSWKTHFHCCGSITKLLGDFAACGVDVLNPVQWTAAGMDPSMLKEKYGNRFTFWGGGIDTQKTLPFGTPEEVRSQVLEKLSIFSPGGGFVFNTIHNILGKTPPENVLAMFEAVKEF